MGKSIVVLTILSLKLLLAAISVQCDSASSSNAFNTNSLSGGGKQISIRMPDIRPDHADQYLCMTRRVKPDINGEFIVGFNPVANANRVHHMLMYGCERPGIYQRDSPNFVWDCSQMQFGDDDKDRARTFEEAPVCRGQQHILYGWALDAPALKLPGEVGFKIGGLDSNIHFLVLQVHYGHYHEFARLPEVTDNSGLILDVKPNSVESGITRRAGVLLLVSLGKVVQGKSKHEIWCEIKDNIDIHPFRFRVHTHKLGTKVFGAKIGKGQQDSSGYTFDQDSIIGVGDPQKPQTFYPVRDNNLTLSRGDSVYAACEFNNNKSHEVKIGATGDDEMCNFYMMYWTDSPNLLTESNCYSPNPVRPYYESLVNKYLGISL